MTFLKPCRALKDAFKFSFALQIPLVILAGLATDGGFIGQVFFYAFLAFNAYLLSVLVFRPRTATMIDLLLIRIGFLPTVVATYFLINYIWDLRGF